MKAKALAALGLMIALAMNSGCILFPLGEGSIPAAQMSDDFIPIEWTERDADRGHPVGTRAVAVQPRFVDDAHSQDGTLTRNTERCSSNT